MNPLKRGFLWLKHYFFSNTLHGTHSPFVYAFLENTVYQANLSGTDKFEQLCQRIINSRAIGKVLVFEFEANADHIVDLYNAEKNNTDEQSIFIFKGIRSTDKSLNSWKKITLDPHNVISIDLFEIGLLFFDQKKPKEHFTIYF